MIVGTLISEYNLLLALIMLMAAFASYRIKKGESAGRKTEHKRGPCNGAGNTLNEVSDAGVNSEHVFQRVLIYFFILGIVLMSVSQYRSICLRISDIEKLMFYYRQKYITVFYGFICCNKVIQKCKRTYDIYH